jgi:hypothetical protein
MSGLLWRQGKILLAQVSSPVEIPGPFPQNNYFRASGAASPDWQTLKYSCFQPLRLWRE